MSHPTTYSLAILAGLQRKVPLFQGVQRQERLPRAVRRRLAHREAVQARSATVARQSVQEAVS
jgi:hypothetical protein